MWTIRVYGSLLGEQVSRNVVSRDPDMVGAGQVHLIYRAMLFMPVGKLDPAKLLRYFQYSSQDREP